MTPQPLHQSDTQRPKEVLIMVYHIVYLGGII